MADDADVVGDEDVGEAELVLQVGEQVDDLRPDRDVEGGDRLVGDDQLRPQRQRPGDPDPLPLAAGELVREAVVVLGGEADPLEQLLHFAAQLGAAGFALQPQRLADDLADPLARVERGVGVLEDHLHLAPQRPHLAPREPGDLTALEADRARARLEQLQDRAARRRLAAARLADQAERLALPTLKLTPSTARTWSTSRSNSSPRLTGKCLTRSVTSSKLPG